MSRGRTLSLTVLLGAVAALGIASTAGAATVAVVNGAVTFAAAPGETNQVTARELTISDAGALLTAGAGCTQVDQHTATCAEDFPVQRPLMVFAGDRDDRVYVDEMCCRQLTLRGELGSDVLTVSSGSGAPADIDGGPGNDTLLSNEQLGGDPVLRGGDGNDTLRICCATTAGGEEYGGAGNDHLDWTNVFRDEAFPLVLDGGGGNDTYTFGLLFVGSSIVPGSGSDTLDQSDNTFMAMDFELGSCSSCVERVIGSPLADRIIGDGRSQAIYGGDGGDTLDGGGGIDTLSGQAGDDTIAARDGTLDAVSCNGGTDSVVADLLDVVSRDCETIQRGIALGV